MFREGGDPGRYFAARFRNSDYPFPSMSRRRPRERLEKINGKKNPRRTGTISRAEAVGIFVAYLFIRRRRNREIVVSLRLRIDSVGSGCGRCRDSASPLVTSYATTSRDELPARIEPRPSVRPSIRSPLVVRTV